LTYGKTREVSQLFRLPENSFPILRTVALISLSLLFTSTAIAETIRSNVVCREDIQDHERSTLAVKLRQISGMIDLRFDDDGVLRLGSRSDSSGSKSARELLARAVQGSNVIIIEDASRRSDVAFARVIQGKWKPEASRNNPVFVVQIDFADFECLIGDELALKAFDEGWAFLHELDHVVENSSDSTSAAEVGECEDHINQMRLECNLPTRAAYFHSMFPVSGENDFATRLVRLSFQGSDGSTEKKKQYWLMWDARVVGITSEKRLAVLR
jgi:hypothetical protein